jgi:hypothetical protein
LLISYYQRLSSSNSYRARDTVCPSKIDKKNQQSLVDINNVVLFLKRYNKDTDLLEPSVVQFSDREVSKLSMFIFTVWRTFGFVRVTQKTVEDDKDKNKKITHYESTNFTLINLYLVIMGPTKENKLTFSLLVVQVKII